MHREFTSSYITQFVIGKDRMFTANANRTETGDMITPDNFRPNPKNPIIASFFRNIGLADELGSGVRNLYHYGKLYSGKEPQLIDGDVFKIIVPLDDNYSFDAQIGKVPSEKVYSANGSGINSGINDVINETRQKIMDLMSRNQRVTTRTIAEELAIDRRNVESHIRVLKKLGLIEREGARKNGRWVVKVE
jgi:ATP-dependent DNA helicase RecG